MERIAEGCEFEDTTAEVMNTFFFLPLMAIQT